MIFLYRLSLALALGMLASVCFWLSATDPSLSRGFILFLCALGAFGLSIFNAYEGMRS